MKRLLLTMSATCLLSSTVFAAASLDSNTGKLSYAMGYRTGQALKAQSITIDQSDFANWLKAGISGATPAVSEKDMQDSLTAMQKQIGEKMQQQYAKLADKNEAEGTAFLAKNAKEAGVVTTASGLQYKVINAGSGQAQLPMIRLPLITKAN